jgi:hypothetical protein
MNRPDNIRRRVKGCGGSERTNRERRGEKRYFAKKPKNKKSKNKKSKNKKLKYKKPKNKKPKNKKLIKTAILNRWFDCIQSTHRFFIASHL